MEEYNEQEPMKEEIKIEVEVPAIKPDAILVLEEPITTNTVEQVKKPKKSVKDKPKNKPPIQIITISKLGDIPSGTKFEVVRQEDDKLFVNHNGIEIYFSSLELGRIYKIM